MGSGVVRHPDGREAEVDGVGHPALREGARPGRCLRELVEREEPVFGELRADEDERGQLCELREVASSLDG